MCTPEWWESIEDDWRSVYEVIDAARHAYGDDMAAFLCWLGVRLIECHRVLREDGSLYLHIDHTAHAWVKCMMDAIFGQKNFRNEIVWWYEKVARGAKGKNQFARNSDVLLYYTKSKSRTFRPVEIDREYTVEEAKAKGFKRDGSGWYKHSHAGMYTTESIRKLDLQGRIYWTKNGKPRVMYRLKNRSGKILEGVKVGNVWDDIPQTSRMSPKERTGYPTQKPLALLDRIIRASSNPGDIVLDPFCGCATTQVAAERLNRQWVGIDNQRYAYDLIIQRLEQENLAVPNDFSGDKTNLITFGSVHYENTPPIRTDDNEVAAPNLKLKLKRPKAPWERLTHAQIREHLLEAQAVTKGVICAGCGRILEKEFMELDHILPRSDGGANDITNRILLCRPCNARKSNSLTLTGLVRANKKAGWTQDASRAKLAQSHAQAKAEHVRNNM